MTIMNIIIVALGIVVLIYIFSDEITGLLRSLSDMFGIRVTKECEPRTPSVSNLAPPRRKDNEEDVTAEEDADDPDEDDLRIARNEHMAVILKPFDRVLVRDDEMDDWHPRFFDYYDDDDDDYPFYCTDGDHYSECIPYEGNEHLYLINKDYKYPET